MDFNQRRVKGEDRRSTTATVKSREVLGLGGKGKGMGERERERERERDGLNEVLQLFIYFIITSFFCDMDLAKKFIN